ncbi:MAG: hypothetical protein ACFCVK_09845 [Acidimicrobiales bacterium]
MGSRTRRMAAGRPTARAVAQSVAVALALLLAGCGDDDGDTATPGATATVTTASGAVGGSGDSGEGAATPAGDDGDDAGAADADGATTTTITTTAGTVEAEVSGAFERYRRALLDRDGNEAVTLASAGTIEWYDSLLVVARQAEPEDLLDRIPLGDAITVVAMRANLGDDLLEVSTGEELFVRGVDDGLVGDDVASLRFDEIVAGDVDEAFGVLDGLEVARFAREDGDWRFDMVYTIETNFSDDNEVEVLAALTGTNGSSRRDLFELLAAAYGSTWEELGRPLG